MTCQDIVHNLYNFYIDNKYHRFLRDNCHEYCTIVGFYLQLFNNTNHECGTELVILKRFLKDKHSYDIILIFDWTIECIMQITYSLVDLVSIILVFEFDTKRRTKSKLYISYKTTFCQNIIPKSINVRFWWNFYQPKRKRMYFLYCFKILFDAQILNIHNLNTNLNYLSSKLLSLHSVFDVQYSVLCITRELLKFLAYRIMLKLQLKFTFNFAICW